MPLNKYQRKLLWLDRKLSKLMVYSLDGGLGQWRCSTYQQAKEQHRTAVEKIKAGLHL